MRYRQIDTLAGMIRLPEPKDLVTMPLYVTWHWSGGSYQDLDYPLSRYHFVLDGIGKVHQGVPVEKNLTKPSGRLPHDYARHVGRGNSNNIGVAVAAMGDATQPACRRGRYGTYPVTAEQVAGLAEIAAHMCVCYDIPVQHNRVLVHSEWQSVRRVQQDHKWDINCLPHLDLREQLNQDGTQESANHLRRLTAARVAELIQAGRPEVYNRYSLVHKNYQELLRSARQAGLSRDALLLIEQVATLDPISLIEAQRQAGRR